MNCSGITTCTTYVDKQEKNFTVIMCTKPDNPIADNQKDMYKRELVEKETGRKLVIRIDNCPQV